MKRPYRLLALVLLLAPAGTIGANASDNKPSLTPMSSGRLFVYGNPVPPPFRFTVEQDSLWINGIPVYPLPDLYNRLDPPSALSHPDAHLNMDRLRTAISREYAQSRSARETPAELAKRLSQLAMRSKDVVDGIAVIDERARITWRADHKSEDMPLVWAEAPAVPQGAPREKRSETQARALAEELSRRRAVIISFHGWFSTANEMAFDQDVREILSRTQGQLTPELWTNQLIPLAMAREISRPISLASLSGYRPQ